MAKRKEVADADEARIESFSMGRKASHEPVTIHHRQRLTKVTRETATGTVFLDEQYTYDALDRRISVSTAINGGTATILNTVYDGDHAYLDLSSTGTATDRRLHGQAVDQLPTA
jgi:YD repeat-containing protein